VGSKLISVIVLAAGEARRFGSPKQLALVGDKTLVDLAVQRNRALDALLTSSRLSLRSVLVLGAHYDKLLANVSVADWSCVAYSKNWKTGMGASLNAGLEAARQDALDAGEALTGAIVCLVDQPMLKADSLLRLIDVGVSRGEISCARYEDSLGTPAYFPSEELERFGIWYRQLAGIDQENGGAKRFILSRPHHAIRLGHELVDIDTKEDLVRLNEQVARDLLK
jgi:molybdenum cofactor cytidylyltransferase